MTLTATIKAGLTALAIDADDKLIAKCQQFLDLITHWNRVTNLTAITEPEEMVTRHLLDSFAVSPYIRGKTLLDVGSGGGLPGIPLALIHPDKAVTLLDANGKKTRFLTQVTIEMGLENVQVVQSRVEDFEGQFDCIVARAFKSLTEFVKVTEHLMADNGSLLAMKGPSEIQAQPHSGYDQRIHRLTIPGLDAERYLVEMTR